MSDDEAPAEEEGLELVDEEDAALERNSDADFTVTLENRLVAYAWLRRGGLRKAGRKDDVLVVASEKMDILLYDQNFHELLEASVPDAEDFFAIKFKLELEGCRVVKGHHTPGRSSRRF